MFAIFLLVSTDHSIARQISALSGQITEVLKVKSGGRHINHVFLKVV
jgi:hypothetical protein